MNYFLTVLKKYAVFNGRAQRKEFWYFALIDWLIGFLIIYIGVGRFTGNWAAPFSWYLIGPFMPTSPVTIFFWVYILALTVPRLAVLVRRMHDVGHSGWYLFIVLIPVYGPVRLLILLASGSQHGENIRSKKEDDSKDEDNKSGYCTKCGKKKDDSKFCTGCGNKN
jgi:uncharacterized membrane protein YhaH (DUF805 family)